MITPKTKANIVSVLKLVVLKMTCIPSSRVKVSLSKSEAFSNSQDIKTRNITTTATLKGGRHVVERAEDTQPVPNMNVHARVI